MTVICSTCSARVQRGGKKITQQIIIGKYRFSLLAENKTISSISSFRGGGRWIWLPLDRTELAVFRFYAKLTICRL